jgi:hypothetical protein
MRKVSDLPLLLPPGEGWDEGIKQGFFLYFDSLTPTLSR